MAGNLPKFERGPVTYQVVEVIKGGQVVEGRTGGKIGVAAAGSTTVLGVATKDSRPPASPNGTNGDGFPVLDISGITEFLAVSQAYHVVTYAANAAFGKALKAAAGGKVTPWVSGTDAADLIIGYCAEPAGVTSAGTTTGLAKIGR